MDPLLKQFRMSIIWGKEYKEKCNEFSNLFHNNVKLVHKGSKVMWKIVKVCRDKDGPRAIIKSVGGKTKELRDYMFNDYTVIELPKAVKVLFGAKDE